MAEVRWEVMFLIASMLLILSYLKSPGAGLFAALTSYIFYTIEKDKVSGLIAIGAIYVFVMISIASGNMLNYITAYLYLPLAVAVPLIYELVVALKGDGYVRPQESRN